MNNIKLATLLLITPLAFADDWTGPDKTQHAFVGAAIGSAATVFFNDPLVGCLAATTVGAAKEIYDYKHPQNHTASFKDFAVTTLAGCLAAKGTGLFVAPNKVMFTFIF